MANCNTRKEQVYEYRLSTSTVEQRQGTLLSCLRIGVVVCFVIIVTFNQLESQVMLSMTLIKSRLTTRYFSCSGKPHILTLFLA